MDRSPGGPPGQGFRQFWGKQPSGGSPQQQLLVLLLLMEVMCVLLQEASPASDGASTCDDFTATKLGRFGFHFKEDDTTYIAWNSPNGNAGHIIPQKQIFLFRVGLH